MNNQHEPMYRIPMRYRMMENLHIVFWLLKDICWCVIYKPLAIAMIFPTLIIAIVITVRNKHYVSEICHNLATVFWIFANSLWMSLEFLELDAEPLYGTMTYKHLAVIPFGIGILILAYYYLWYKPRHKEMEETM